ncbi:hypothetical protein [Propionivibrio sp.]|uniref:hypothetical protein n=1 Tax=Propionivibrio sp. TaxID=2212460 RepID=UPI003BEFDA82
MKPLRQSTLLLLLLAVLPALSSAGPMRQYNSELGATVTLVKSGALKQAVALVEKNNEGADKDILYFFEKGELFSLGSNYTTSRDSWLKSDEVIQAWENDFRTNSGKLFGDIGSYLISDKTRRYDGQDYEKVLLSTRLTLNHIMLGNFDLARIEMKKTYEREKLIEAFREQEYDALKTENEKQGTGQITKLDGYPMEELDTPEVRELKNGFQNAFAHYLAGYFFEVTDEPSLAEPGYRNALLLAPGKASIQSALEGVGKVRPAPGEADVLFVIESGFAPVIDSLNIPIPIPRKNGVIITPLSFPVIKSSSQVLVPPSLVVAGRELPVETLTNTDAMARRLLKDQMPGIILRSVIRAGFKSVVQDQANKAHWLAGLLANVVAVTTEQADDRNWRTLPERISVARANLPHGKHLIEFQTNAGSYRAEVEVASRFTIVPIRITGGAVYVGQPNLAQGSAPDFVAEKTIQPNGAGLPEPVPTPPAAAVATTPSAPAPITLTSLTSLAAQAETSPPGESARAASAAQPLAVSGKRVKAGDTTYIGDFRFAPPSGLPSGQGAIEWDNGDRFEGRLENGLRHGIGTFTSKTSGFRYEGDWLANKQNGKGKTTFDVGDAYEGEMKDGEFHGQGTYTSKNGIRYEGSWKNGVKEGKGKIVFPDGDFWEGDFSNGERTDQSKMIFTGKPVAKPEPEAVSAVKP